MTLKERLGLSDRDILAKTIQAEAGNQGAQGMLAVGSVIMNRTKASGYGGSIQDVILKPGQFSPWNSETNYAGGAQGQDMMNLVASPQAYAVTDAVLSGKAPDPTSGATHFYNDRISNPSWGAEKQGGDWTRIGAHLFGKADAGRSSNQIIADDAMRAIGKQPIGLADANITGLADANIKENSQMMQQRRPRGLLENFGIQKMQEGAEGETGQRFYNRDTFKDRLADLAVGFGKMGIMGLDEPAAAVANRRAARRDKNKTVEYLMANGREDLAGAVRAGTLTPRDAAGIMFAQPKGQYKQVSGSELGYEGKDANRLFNVGPDGKITSIGGTGPVTNVYGEQKMPPGLEAMDKEFGKKAAELSMSGLADARNQSATINTVLKKLESGEKLTSPLIGAQPDFLRAILNPEAQDAIDRVGSVVQRSLREVLGGQFAQKEGEQLVKRAYNPSLKPEQNAARLRALFSVLDQTAKNKMEMVEYFRKDYTLRGYEGNLKDPTVEDLEAAMDAAVPSTPSTTNSSPKKRLKYNSNTGEFEE